MEGDLGGKAEATTPIGGSSIGAPLRGKETAHASERDRPDVLKRREAWFDSRLGLAPSKLVFIDGERAPWLSNGLNTKTVRRYGRSPRSIATWAVG